MNFDIYGGFEIMRNKDREGLFDKDFWNRVASKNGDLPDACGCYLFALQNGDNIITWYVGKTEKKNFRFECFQPTKKIYFDSILRKRNGKPVIFLIPRLTNSGKKFSKPTKSGYRDIDFLETILIGMALEQNKDLLNIQKTKLLRDMKVPGVINNPQARPKKPVATLRNALGLNRK